MVNHLTFLSGWVMHWAVPMNYQEPYPPCVKRSNHCTTADVADSGTATKMEGTHDEETCVKMWHELNDANDGKVTDHSELTDLWFRNLEEHGETC